MTGFLFACLVVKILDGDTWICDDGTHVRAFAINSVERGEPGYKEAGAALRKLIQNRVLWCRYQGTSHERLVARCVREDDGLDPAAEQVKAGLATSCPAFSAMYLPLEKPGLTRADFCEPKKLEAEGELP